ncbi:MAG: beta-propeller fold lactonase family protein [Lachnospiraceae bacterium]|nr:beta-propeller fold lactonase family protein [Lachnospiraceae bacterium]
MKKFVYVGCRTTRERNARGKGLKVYQVLDDENWKEVQTLYDEKNPSYQCIDKTGKYLYSVHGDSDFVSAFKINLEEGILTHINTIEGVGKNPVFITVDNTNEFLYAASLQGGQISVIKRNLDGGISFPIFSERLCGKTDESVSLAHQCLWDKNMKFLFVPAQGRGVGFGEINVFKKQEDGSLISTDCVFTREVDEPRHLAIHNNNRFLYCVNEKGNSVTFYIFDEGKGKLTPKQIVPSLPETYVGEGQASAIIISMDGKYLYQSNRIHDSITVYSIDEKTGYIKAIANVSCLGKTPRFMTLNPEGTELVVANEDSDDIRIFKLNNQGIPEYSGKVIFTESPVCITFGYF